MAHIWALLSRVSILIDLGRLQDAEKEINELKRKLAKPKQNILRGIEAKLLLAKGDLDNAVLALGTKLDEVKLGLRVQIELSRAEQYKLKGYTTLCKEALETAQKYIEEGKAKYLHNQEYLGMEKQIKTFKCS